MVCQAPVSARKTSWNEFLTGLRARSGSPTSTRQMDWIGEHKPCSLGAKVVTRRDTWGQSSLPHCEKGPQSADRTPLMDNGNEDGDTIGAGKIQVRLGNR